MTSQKSFKTLVRSRMDKTGESYTTARRRLRDKTSSDAKRPSVDSSAPEAHPADDAPASPPDAGEAVRSLQFSDDAVRERTGRHWEDWFALLDAWGGTDHSHTEIARWLVQEHDVPGWWAQSITVTYEQARGMRVPGQRPDGSFYASGSKTVSVPVDRLFEAFNDPELREQWLPGIALDVRTATAPKSLRADWSNGSGRLVATFTAKGDAKSQVGIGHEKLPDAESATRMKEYWRERLAVLKELLES